MVQSIILPTEDGASQDVIGEEPSGSFFLDRIFTCMTKEKIIEAIEIFGDNVVSEVRTLVDVSDPDGCYTMFEDMGMFEHAECVEFLYFE